MGDQEKSEHDTRAIPSQNNEVLHHDVSELLEIVYKHSVVCDMEECKVFLQYHLSFPFYQCLRFASESGP